MSGDAIPVEEALAMLDTFQQLGDDQWGPWRVHTILVGKSGMKLGADWDLEDIKVEMAKCPPHRAGPQATAMGHGIVLMQAPCRSLFVATRKEAEGA